MRGLLVLEMPAVARGEDGELAGPHQSQISCRDLSSGQRHMQRPWQGPRRALPNKHVLDRLSVRAVHVASVSLFIWPVLRDVERAVPLKPKMDGLSSRKKRLTKEWKDLLVTLPGMRDEKLPRCRKALFRSSQTVFPLFIFYFIFKCLSQKPIGDAHVAYAFVYGCLCVCGICLPACVWPASNWAWEWWGDRVGAFLVYILCI